MIIDASVILGWTLTTLYQKECRMLRKGFEDGEFVLRTPSLVKYDVCKAIVTDKSIPGHFVSRFAELLLKYLNYLSVELKESQLAKAIQLSRELGVELSVASCLVLANSVGEAYVTADRELSSGLKKLGYPVIHVKETL